MDRRAFLGGLFAAAGAGAALAASSGPSQAASLLDELQALDVKAIAPEADLPAESAEEAQYYYGAPRAPRHYRPRPYSAAPYHRPRPYYARPHYARPRRRVCRRVMDAWGRWVRQCYWV